MRDYLRSRHICLVTPDLPKAVADVEAIFGVAKTFVDPEVEVFEIENALFPFGLALVEIAAPTAPTAAVTRFLRSSGGRGGYVIAFHCSDPAARAERAKALGIRVIADLDYTHGNFHAFQLHPKDCGGVMLEFDHTTGGEALLGPSYAAGGADWIRGIDTRQTLGITDITMTAEDPGLRAAQWADLLGLPVAAGPEGPRIEMDLFSLRFAAAAAGARPCFSGIGVKVKEPGAVLAQARARGYPTGPDWLDFCGVTFHLR